MSRKYRLLDYTARLELEKLWNGANALSVADIARELGVHTATLYRELERGYVDGVSFTRFRQKYSADKAQEVVNAGNRRRTGRLKQVSGIRIQEGG